MSDRFSYTEPELCTYNFDVSKSWFVYFDYTDQLSGTTLRKQFRGGINRIKEKKERLLEGKALQSYWKTQLRGGWNPFVFGEDIPEDRPRILDAFNRILTIKEASCGKRTGESYRHCIKLFSEWIVKNRLSFLYIDQLDATIARNFFDYLTLKKGYVGRTFNDKAVVLSTFSNCMIEREWIIKNPFAKIKKLPVNIGRNIAFSEDERILLREYLKRHDIRLYYFTQFIYYCFIRRSELTRLKVGNIDFKNMTIVIPSNASKNRKQESVVIPNSFAPILKEINLDKLPPDYYLFGRHLQPGPVQYVNYNHISTRHNSITKSLGIDPEKGLYSWKHSGVCALYPLLGGDVYALMRQLRHTELTTTQIYLKSLGLSDNSAVRDAKW